MVLCCHGVIRLTSGFIASVAERETNDLRHTFLIKGVYLTEW